MSDLKKLAKDYFERHNESQECYITSNGLVFHTPSFAQSYVNSAALRDETITPFKRETFLKMVKPADAKPADEPAEENPADEPAEANPADEPAEANPAKKEPAAPAKPADAKPATPAK